MYKVLLTMQSGLLVAPSGFLTLQLVTVVCNTTARSPKLASWFISFLQLCECRVSRLAAVSIHLTPELQGGF